MGFSFKNEIDAFFRAVKQTKFTGISYAHVGKELLVNGISAILAIGVSALLSKFFTVKSFRNLWGIAKRKDKLLVDKDTYEWLNAGILFIVGLFVFSIVEDILNKYVEERKRDKDNSTASHAESSVD